jgi:hypothetical protein
VPDLDSSPGLKAPRWITYVRLCDLLPAIRNPKKHHLPGLIASLERHGWTQPVLADERTQRLVAGHGRMAAAVEMKAAGDSPPEGVLVDDDGEWLVPVCAAGRPGTTPRPKPTCSPTTG